MAIQNLDYFYDGQNRRMLEQLVRAFSGFQYQTGYNAQGGPQLLMVPCTLANTNRQVGNLLRNNSENALISAPRITVWQTGLTGRREDVQYPGHIDTLQAVEREVNGTTHKYTMNRGNAYTVQRLMPRPFQMDIQVDLWTTNLDQKYQLLEQILTVIYPSFDIQNSQNVVDWTALTTVFVEEVTLSSRTVPIGADSEIDVSSIRLRVPMWLSPPAKVKQQTIIKQILTNIFDADAADLTDGYGGLAGAPGAPGAVALLARDITTPGDHHIRVDGASITLLGADAREAEEMFPGDGTDSGDAPARDSNEWRNRWPDLLQALGKFRPTQSRIRLYYTDDPEGAFVAGTLQFDATAANRLVWQIDPDTIPANTLAPINAVIDPLRTFPGAGLPSSDEGVRYMLVADVGPSQAWGPLSAREHDIVERRNGAWQVAFAAHASQSAQLVLNLHSGSQLRWTGRDWVMSIDGLYAPGFWRLAL